MLAFVDQSGNPHPNDVNPGAVLLAACMRESTMFDLSRIFHSIKSRYHWEDGGVQLEVHAKDCGSQRAFRKRNRTAAWRVFRACARAALKTEVATLMVISKRPSQPPVTPDRELPAPYFFLLQRIEALAAKWREAQVTVVFDEVGRGDDRRKAVAYSNLIHTYGDGRSFNRLLPVALFADSHVNLGIQIADIFAYIVFMHRFGSKRPSLPLDSLYMEQIAELADDIYARSPYLFDFHNRNEYFGTYEMPEKHFYSRAAQ